MGESEMNNIGNRLFQTIWAIGLIQIQGFTFVSKFTRNSQTTDWLVSGLQNHDFDRNLCLWNSTIDCKKISPWFRILEWNNTTGRYYVEWKFHSCSTSFIHKTVLLHKHNLHSVGVMWFSYIASRVELESTCAFWYTMCFRWGLAMCFYFSWVFRVRRNPWRMFWPKFVTKHVRRSSELMPCLISWPRWLYFRCCVDELNLLPLFWCYSIVLHFLICFSVCIFSEGIDFSWLHKCFI
jgi:hypothetical protein